MEILGICAVMSSDNCNPAQVEAQNGAILGDKMAVEQEKTGLREELVRVEQEKLDVENEKQGQYLRLQ